MNDLNSLNLYFNSFKAIDFQTFFADLLLLSLLSILLSFAYIKFGFSVSNRQKFALNFIFLSIATMIVISIIKSSLALSLGLVGALSIVRFRAPIKDPEELIFLFIAIALGLGFGAEQREIVLIGVIFIVFLLVIRYLIFKNKKNTVFNLFIQFQDLNDNQINLLMKYISSNSQIENFKRLDIDNSKVEVLINYKLKSKNDIFDIKKQLNKISDNFEISFFDDKDINFQ